MGVIKNGLRVGLVAAAMVCTLFAGTAFADECCKIEELNCQKIEVKEQEDTKNDLILSFDELKIGVTDSIKVKVRKSNSVTFTWNKVKNATGYRLYIAQNGKWVRLHNGTAATTCTVNKLAAGTSYTFAVKAYRTEDGETTWSESFKTIKINTLPGRTTKISKQADGKDKMRFTWNKVKGATGYTLYYKKNGQWITIQKFINNNKIRVIKLLPNKSYTFAIRAYTTENGKTVWSDCYTPITIKTAK